MKFQRTFSAFIGAATAVSSAALFSALMFGQDAAAPGIDQTEATRILHEGSAWSQKAKVNMPSRPQQDMGGGGGRRNGGGERAGGQPMQAPEVTLVWESSNAAKLAIAKTYGPDALGHNDDYYAISLTGLGMMGGGRRGAEGGDDQERVQRAVAMLVQGTKLKVKNKPDIQAVKADVIVRNGVRTVVVMFPRDTKIGADDKDVEFECKIGTPMGNIELKAKFHPKDMAYNGKLELYT